MTGGEILLDARHLDSAGTPTTKAPVNYKSYKNLADHRYIVSIDMINELMVCTCPHHIHRNTYCKHMAAVENATDDGTLETFPSLDEDDTEPAECDRDVVNVLPY